MKFYLVDDPPRRLYSGEYTEAYKWGLPGVKCPVCHAVWSNGSDAYPSVDLSHFSLQEQKKYSARLEEDYGEFERLREQVRPLVPPGVPLWPGTHFGPMNGRAQGEFGPLVMAYCWTLLMQREPLEHLQAEGLRGLKGCPTQLRFRKKNPPELLEMELLPRGRLHADCLPPGPAPCPKCERNPFKRPAEPILDAATLSQGLDLFRCEDFMTMILCTERFVEAVRRLGYEQDIVFREIPRRGPEAE